MLIYYLLFYIVPVKASWYRQLFKHIQRQITLKHIYKAKKKKAVPTERPPFVDEVSSNFDGKKVSRDQRNGSPWSYYRFSRPEQLILLSSRSSFVLTKLNGPEFFWELVDLERGLLSLVNTIEDLLESNTICSGLEKR
jgi:hypothetical protein